MFLYEILEILSQSELDAILLPAIISMLSGLIAMVSTFAALAAVRDLMASHRYLVLQMRTRSFHLAPVPVSSQEDLADLVYCTSATRVGGSMTMVAE